MSKARSSLMLALSGVLLLQVAWILAVPPFRGLDEHEHAYKAAAVARGDFSPHHPESRQGWGQLVVVPEPLVRAARPVCESLPYTTPDNCRGTRSVGPGLREVSSSAATYNPTYYVLPGLVSRLFQGTAALYAMRATGALMCALLLLLALVATHRWAQTRWPLVAFLSTCTPMLLYSISMHAPNGTEVAAAALVWSALLGLARAPSGAPVDRVLVVLATVGAVPLTLVRGLGPVWLLLIALTVALLARRERLLLLVRDRAVWTATAVTVLATLAASAWTLSAGFAEAASHEVVYPTSPWPKVPGQWVLWFFQSVAAFPTRNEMAPLATYAFGFAGWLLIVAVALRIATRRERLALLVIVLAASAVAIGITVVSYAQLGTSWQGRYGYPYALGFFLICGTALDRWAIGRSSRGVHWAMASAGVIVLLVLLIGELALLRGQRVSSPLAGTTAWVEPTDSIIILLDVLGVGLLWWGLDSLPLRRAAPTAPAPGFPIAHGTR